MEREMMIFEIRNKDGVTVAVEEDFGNAARERSVPESIAIKSWRTVQSNIGKFSQHFRQNFLVVDNNDATEDVMTPVFKQIQGLLRKKVKSPLAKQWVMQQMKDRGITKTPKGF